MVAMMAVVGLGAFWLGRREAATGSPTAQPAPDARENARLRGENARLLAEIEMLKNQQITLNSERNASRGAAAGGGTEPPRLDALGVLLDIQRQKSGSVRVPIIARDGKLTDGFAKLFGLTEAETAALQGTLEQGRREIDELSRANATVSQADDSLVVTVKPFDGGGEIYDRLMDAFARTLGPERNKAFLALQADQLSGAFSAFGAERRTLTFSREATADGIPSVVLRDQRMSPNSSSASVSGFSDPTKIPDQYRWLIPLVPQVGQLPVHARPNGRVDTLR